MQTTANSAPVKENVELQLLLLLAVPLVLLLPQRIRHGMTYHGRTRQCVTCQQSGGNRATRHSRICAAGQQVQHAGYDRKNLARNVAPLQL